MALNIRLFQPPSGTDTIKRGASPASVKFKESSSSYSLKSDTSRILSNSSSLVKKYGTNGNGGDHPSPAVTSGSPLHYPASVSASTSLLLSGNGATGNGGSLRKQRDGNGSSSTNNGPNISSSSDLQLPSRSVLFSSDYLSSSAAAAAATSTSSTATTTERKLSFTALTGPVSSLDVATFSLDDKNNLVVSPSPSSASESSHHSSNSSLRERSPQPSPSLKRQEPIDRSDSTATTTAAGGSSSSSSSFMSSLRSQTLGSYQFPSSNLVKLPGQLSADSAGSGDDGSTSSLLRKLGASLSRTITSNTGTLPLSLGRQGGTGSSLYQQQDASYSVSSSSSSSGKPTSASLNYTSPGSSLLGEGGSGQAVTTAAAVSSMSIYGTLPKNSSIYSYSGAASSLLSGTSSSYGISDRFRALTSGGSAGDSSSGLGSSLTASGGSGADSAGADLGASGYDYESSGFSSSAGLTSSSYGGTSSTSASMTTSATSGLSSSYFSTGSGNSPFGTMTSNGSDNAGPPTYRVQYSSTNPFLPSYNPPSDNGGSTSLGGANGRNGGLKSSDEDDSFDMK